MNLAIIEYSILAAEVLLLGAAVGSFLKMSSKTISLTQHFTAGVVFAAVATELLPKILEVHSPMHIAIGFSLGVILMVLIKTLTGRIETSNQFSWGLLVGIGIDLFIDGLLIAIAFLSGEKTGKLMALALVLEVAFLALSLSTDLIQKKTTSLFRIGIFVAFSLLIPLGTGTGILILNLLPPAFFTEALSFGAAALLYLVTEELLVEAHETKDTPIITSSFFLGFLIIFLFKD
jgi:zinc transporter, ZIP family